MQLFALCGSLRRESRNLSVLRAAQQLAAPPMMVEIYDGLAALPHFNPEVEESRCPPEAERLRVAVRSAAAVLVCTPEYAHGVPGVLKNALDWLVGSDAPLQKPTAVINASARSTYADAQVRETMRVMGFRIVEAASITLPLDGLRLDAEGIARHATLSAALRAALDALRAG